MSRCTKVTSWLGPLLFLLGLLLLTSAACGEPEVSEPGPLEGSPREAKSLSVSPDERVGMASGLSVVLPDHLAGTLFYGRDDPAMYAELLLAEPDPDPTRWEGVALLSLESEAQEMPQLASFEETAEVIAQNRHVKVLWGGWEDENWLMVVTRLPEHATGILWHQLSSAGDSAEARREVEQLWKRFSVQGASLPL